MPKKYETEEERLQCKKEARKRSMAKPWTCEICNKTMSYSNRTNHERTTAHRRKACNTYSESE